MENNYKSRNLPPNLKKLGGVFYYILLINFDYSLKNLSMPLAIPSTIKA